MPKIQVGDIGMYYVEAGRGEPVVLIMGLGADHLAWGFQFRALAERFRVVAFDNRGAGRTDAPDVPYTTRLMAADTLGLMDALGIDRAHVVGVSMGGMVAQELVLAAPERVRSLHLGVTLARPNRWIAALLDAWRRIFTAFDREAALRMLSLWLFTPATHDARPALVELMIGNAVASPYPQSVTGFLRQADAVASHDTLERLPAIRCPTLVSVAEHDILVPQPLSREVAARIPGAELREVAGAGHACFWERADDFTALCLDFLERHRGR